MSAQMIMIIFVTIATMTTVMYLTSGTTPDCPDIDYLFFQLSPEERLDLIKRLSRSLEEDQLKSLIKSLFGLLPEDGRPFIFELAKTFLIENIAILLVYALLCIGILYLVFQFFRAPQRSRQIQPEEIPLVDISMRGSPDTYNRPYYVSEKYVAGSELFKIDESQYPRFQVKISAYGRNSKENVLLQTGMGFRDEDNKLVTAAHILEGADLVLLEGPYGTPASIEVAEFTINAVVDYAHVVLPPRVWSGLAIQAASYPKKWDGTASVAVTDLDQVSTGILTDSQHIFNAEYAGTTIPGFSGAPLFKGNVVYGLHLGAGQHNYALTFGALRFLSDNPHILNGPKLRYVPEKNKKSKNRRSKVDDDAYLDYAKLHAQKTGKKLKVSALDREGFEHGVIVKGAGGRIVFSEEFDPSYMELIERPSNTRRFKEESKTVETLLETPQFLDIPVMSNDFLAKVRVSVSDTPPGTASSQSGSSLSKT